MPTSPFIITPTPPTTLELEPGREGTFSFTLTSLAAPDRVQELVLEALLIGADRKGTEVSWLVAGPQRTLGLTGGETATVTITARPTTTTPAGEHRIKLAVADNANPNDVFADSAPVICKVVAAGQPEVAPPRKRFPLWLIAAIAGAVVVLGGGIFGIVKCTSDSPRPRVCDHTTPFDPPVLMSELSTPHEDVAAHLSPDELQLYFASTRPGGMGLYDLYETRRSRIGDPFGPVSLIPGVNSPAHELDPSVSADGLTIALFSNRLPNLGTRMFLATRPTTSAAFAPPSLLDAISSTVASSSDMQPFLTADGRELWFASDRTGQLDLYRATRVGPGFGNAVAVSELNTPAHEALPIVSADRLTIYFATARGVQLADIWSSHRNSVNEPFPPPAPVAIVNTPSSDHPSWVSPDNCRLYLTSGIGGNQDLYVASRRPR